METNRPTRLAFFAEVVQRVRDVLAGRILRPYQNAAIIEMLNALRNGRRRILLVQPTGAGKTVVFCSICDLMLAYHGRVLILVHHKELVDQAVRHLASRNITAGVIRADDRRTNYARMVQVASVQTIVRRLNQFKPDRFPVIIIDEAHHVAAATYKKILQYFSGKGFVLGVTATPIRDDGESLKPFFDKMIIGATISGLIAAKYLVPVRMFSADRIDLVGIRTVAGDYDKHALGVRLNEKRLTGSIVGEWRKWADGRPTLGFAVSVEHSKQITRELVDAGIPALHVDAKTSEADREAAVAALGCGKIKVLMNNLIFTEGFDLPDISCIILARPTKNLGLYLQMAGRGLRPAPGKTDCMLLDHANCWDTHGPIDEDQPWVLEGDRGAKKKAASSPRKRCLECGAINRPGAAICVECGHPFPIVASAVVYAPGELTERGHRVQDAIEAPLATPRGEYPGAVEPWSDDQKHKWFLDVAKQCRALHWKASAPWAKFCSKFDEFPEWSWVREAGISYDKITKIWRWI